MAVRFTVATVIVPGRLGVTVSLTRRSTVCSVVCGAEHNVKDLRGCVWFIDSRGDVLHRKVKNRSLDLNASSFMLVDVVALVGSVRSLRSFACGRVGTS